MITILLLAPPPRQVIGLVAEVEVDVGEKAVVEGVAVVLVAIRRADSEIR